MIEPSHPRDSLTPRVPTSELSSETLPVIATDLAIAEYLEDCRSRGLALPTLKGYAWALARLKIGCPTLPTDRKEVRSVLAAQSLADETRKDLRRSLQTFFVWVGREYGHPNPLDQLAKTPHRKTLPRILRDDEVTALWGAALWRRDQALVALPLDTGLRVGEIANMRWRDLGPDYLVVAAEGKTGSRRVPLSPNVREFLDGLGDDEHIWIGKKGPLGTWGIQQIYQRLFRRAGIAGRKNGAHTLRHCFATGYLRSGGQLAALQKILGHQDISTTMIYVHLSGVDVGADHAIHSPIHHLGLTQKLKSVPVLIPPHFVEPRLF